MNLNKKPADEHVNAIPNITNAENAGDLVTDAEKPVLEVEENFPCNECGKVFRRYQKQRFSMPPGLISLFP